MAVDDLRIRKEESFGNDEGAHGALFERMPGIDAWPLRVNHYVRTSQVEKPFPFTCTAFGVNRTEMKCRGTPNMLTSWSLSSGDLAAAVRNNMSNC